MKQFIYSLVAMLLVFTGSLQAQTKAIPEDPTVPHFVTLEQEGEGEFTANATYLVNGQEEKTVIKINQSTDLPYGAQLELIAEPAEGWKLQHIVDAESGDFLSAVSPYPFGYLTENRKFKALFIEEDKFTIQINGDHFTTEGELAVKAGEPLDITLTADEYYLLPESIQMWENSQPTTDFTYARSEDGKTATLHKDVVNGDISVSIEVIDNHYYQISVIGEPLTVKGMPENESIQHGSTLELTLVPDEGFRLPTANISVTMAGQPVYPGFEVREDGSIFFIIQSVTGDVVVKANVISASEVYDITYESDPLNFHYDTEVGDGLIPPTVVAGAPLKVLLVPDAGYVIPEANVTVTMGGKELSGVYSLSEDFRVGEIYIESVMGDVTISVVAKMLTFADIFDDSELDGEILIEEVPMIKLYQELTLTLSAAEGYHLPETIDVEMNGELLAEGEGYTYNSETGELVIKSVEGIIKIIAQAEPDEPKPDPDPDPEDPDDPDPTPTPDPDPEDPDDPDVPTATADISGDVVKVWAANGVLHIHTPQPATVRVVSFSGALFRLMDVPGGDVQFTLPDNLYIVTVGDEVKKIKVR